MTLKDLFTKKESSIFKYINPFGNDKFSDLKGLDLQDLIILINNYYLQLRDTIGIDDYITFGLELEFEHCKKDKIEKELEKNKLYDNGWKIKRDSTLIDGAEINSPILMDTKQTWEELDEVCSIVNPLAKIDVNSGGHIHIGTHILGIEKNSWINFLKLWSVYENIIFRFSYGEYLTSRPEIMQYASVMKRDFWKKQKEFNSENKNINKLIQNIKGDKYNAVNFGNVDYINPNYFSEDNTIEFRCPNGTLEPVIWQNNVNFFVKLLLYSKSTSFNDDLVQKRHKLTENKYYGLEWYKEIYIDQALELCDMMFDNNLDKVYFLRQYLKSFEVSKDNKYIKAKSLTKKK